MNLSAGFEFYADPDDPTQSFITWVSDGQPSYSMTGAAVGPDTTVGVGQRLIAPEPMVRSECLRAQ